MGYAVICPGSREVLLCSVFFFFQAEDGIRDLIVTGVQTCALPIFLREQKLSATQLVDPTTAIRIGKLVAAEATLVVTVNESPKSVEAYAQLISTEKIGRASCRERV